MVKTAPRIVTRNNGPVNAARAFDNAARAFKDARAFDKDASAFAKDARAFAEAAGTFINADRDLRAYDKHTETA